MLFEQLPVQNSEALVQRLEAKNVPIDAKEPKPSIGAVLLQLLPWMILIGLWLFFFRQVQQGGNRAFAFGKSKAKLLTGDTPKVTFADVAGADEAKQELQEIIEFLGERALRSCPLGLAEMARHLLNCPDRTAELASIADLPKLISYGENDDAWSPDVQDLMAKRLGATRVCIPAAAHSPAVEAPETTASMLTAFWNQAETAR